MIPIEKRSGDGSACAEPSDALLVALAAAGDEKGCELLVRRFAPLLMGILFGRVNDRADVEDIVQETFIAAFPHLSRMRQPERLGPWLVRIARNKLKDHYRARARRPVIEMLPGRMEDETGAVARIAAPGASPSQHARSGETRRMVMGAIGEFSERYRVILYLRLIEESEPHEIAARLALKESTVRMRLMRGLEKLRRILLKRGIAG